MTEVLWIAGAVIWFIVIVAVEADYRGVDLRLPVVTRAWEWIREGIRRALRMKRK